MKVDILNQNKEKIETIELPENFFKVKFNHDLVHQVFTSMMANRRQPLAHTKGRSDVSGGGKKPWKQKGTGRARHGSIRSPIWKGGGVTFGPKKETNFSKKINKKMKRKALLMTLSQKLKETEFMIIDNFQIEKTKTKLMSKLLFNFLGLSKNAKKISALLVTDKSDKNIIRSGKNLPSVGILEVKNLNLIDLLTYKYLIMTKGAILNFINLAKEEIK